jgi:hypothetical protein
MVKYVSFVRKKANMSRAEFERRWLGGHASIVKRFPKLRRYSITFIQDGPETFTHTNLDFGDSVPVPADLAGWDGYAELWFDSLEDLKAAKESEVWSVESAADRDTFIGEFINAPVKAEHRII